MSDLYLPPEDADEPQDFFSERQQDPSGDGAANDFIIEGHTSAGGDAEASGEHAGKTSDSSRNDREPVPQPLLVSSPSPRDFLPEGLRDRIARVTREGGFGRNLPPTYDDPDADPPGEDWKSVLSHDPFERLFLDWRQAGSIPDQTVPQHGIAIAKFWEHKAKLLEKASTDIRGRILRTFGDRSRIKGYETQAYDDAEALATPEKRTAAVEVRINTIRTRILARFEDFVLGDRTLSPNETELLLAQADAEGWSRSTAATFLLSELHRRGFRNETGAEPKSEDDHSEVFLLSSSWIVSGKKRSLRPEQVIGLPLATAMLTGSITAAQIQSLLAEAVKVAFANGAKELEAYPIRPYTANVPAAFAWTGVPVLFKKQKFVNVTPPSNARPIYRKALRAVRSAK